MDSLPPYRTTLVDEQHWMTAKLYMGNHSSDLTIEASPLIEETDPMWAPIDEILAESCHSTMLDETLDDPEMMFGEVRRRIFAIHGECPGDVPHNCFIARLRPNVRMNNYTRRR